MLFDSAFDTWKILVLNCKKQTNTSQPTSITLGEKSLNVALWHLTGTGRLDPLLCHPSKPWRLGSNSQDPHPN